MDPLIRLLRCRPLHFAQLTHFWINCTVFGCGTSRKACSLSKDTRSWQTIISLDDWLTIKISSFGFVLASACNHWFLSFLSQLHLKTHWWLAFSSQKENEPHAWRALNTFASSLNTSMVFQWSSSERAPGQINIFVINCAIKLSELCKSR